MDANGARIWKGKGNSAGVIQVSVQQSAKRSTLEAPGYLSLDVSDAIVAGGEHVCRLSRGAILNVAVRDLQGSSVAGAPLQLWQMGPAGRMVSEVASAAGVASWEFLAPGRYRLSISGDDHALVDAPEVIDLKDSGAITIVVQPLIVAILQSDKNASFSLVEGPGWQATVGLPPSCSAAVSLAISRKYPDTRSLVLPMAQGERCPSQKGVKVAFGGGEYVALVSFDVPSASRPQFLAAPDASPLRGGLSLELIDSRGLPVKGVVFTSKGLKGSPLRFRSGETHWLEPGRYEIKCGDRVVFPDLAAQVVEVRRGETSMAAFATKEDVKEVELQCRPPGDLSINYAVVTFEKGERRWVVRTMRPDKLKLWLPTGPLRVTAETPTIAKGTLEASVSDSVASPLVIEMKQID